MGVGGAEIGGESSIFKLTKRGGSHKYWSSVMGWAKLKFGILLKLIQETEGEIY